MSSKLKTTEECSRKYYTTATGQLKNTSKLVFLKTQLCRNFQKGTCRLGNWCRYAHGNDELRDTPNFFKTRLCPSYLKEGKCRYGDACSFAHDRTEIRAEDPYYRTTICLRWRSTGSCPNRDTCRYAHGKHELRKVPEHLTIPEAVPNSQNADSSLSDLRGSSNNQTKDSKYYESNNKDKQFATSTSESKNKNEKSSSNSNSRNSRSSKDKVVGQNILGNVRRQASSMSSGRQGDDEGLGLGSSENSSESSGRRDPFIRVHRAPKIPLKIQTVSIREMVEQPPFDALSFLDGACDKRHSRPCLITTQFGGFLRPDSSSDEVSLNRTHVSK